MISHSLVAQLVKNLPAVWETCIWSLGEEDPPDKGTVIHSGILAWISGEFHGLYSTWSHKESDTTEGLSYSLECFLLLFCFISYWIVRVILYVKRCIYICHFCYKLFFLLGCFVFWLMMDIHSSTMKINMRRRQANWIKKNLTRFTRLHLHWK